MRKIRIFLEGGVIQQIEPIPDDITIRVHEDSDEYSLPENRSDDDYAIAISWNLEDVKQRAKENGLILRQNKPLQFLSIWSRNMMLKLALIGIPLTTILRS